MAMKEEDEKKISAAKAAYNEAKARGDTAGMEKAHADAEAVRANYGYSGGADGSENNALSSGGGSSGGRKDANGRSIHSTYYDNVKRGLVGTSTDYGTYKSDLDKLTKAQRQAQVDELKAARTAALANLDAQEQTIKPTYQNARNLTSASSQQGARNFAEYLANRGLANSGAAAQSEINRLSALNNNLGNINQAEANAYRDIANQRTAVENNYVSGLANANNALTNNYYNNLLNYNEQQRQYLQQLQQRALGQYANDYQAYKNELLAQGYSPNSLEVLTVDALRGDKMNNAYSGTYNYNTSLQRIANGTWDYNDLLATGMTNEQATKYHNDTVAAAQAQQEQTLEQLAYDRGQQDFKNNIELAKLANATAETNYKINEPYNTTVYHVSSGGGNKNSNNDYLSVTEVNKIIDGLDAEQARKKIDSLYNNGKIEDWVFDLYQ